MRPLCMKKLKVCGTLIIGELRETTYPVVFATFEKFLILLEKHDPLCKKFKNVSECAASPSLT